MTIGGPLRLADDLAVARLGYGAMRLPGPQVWGPPADPEAARAVLRRAVELGVTHIDTSDAYGPHVANDLIGQALHPYPGDLVIATKIGLTRDATKAFTPAASPRELREQVEENRTRLGIDRLDLVYLRAGGDGLLQPGETPFAESYATLAELRRDGLIRHLGLSGVTVEQLKEATEIAPVAAVQNRYHLLDRSGEDVLRACEERGVAFVPYFPLAAGLLKPGLDIPPGMGPSTEQQHTLDEVAARHGATRAQVALAWLLGRSPNILAIPGTSSLAHLEENVAAAELVLTADDRALLDAL
jgi:pyridoxine 4-dehydrogenase